MAILKTLVRKNVILDAGLLNQDNNNISFSKMQLMTAADDPTLVQIPDIGTVAEIVNDISNSPFDIKYRVIIQDANVYPNAHTLNTLYNGTGIFVEEILTGNTLLLKATPNGSDQIKATDGDGILFVVEPTGVFQVAGMVQNLWLIDNTKNNQATVINQIDTRITALEQKDIAIENNITTLDANNVKIDNAKDISSRGSFVLGSTVSDPFKIPTRGDVNTALISLDNKAINATTVANGAVQTANAVQTALGTTNQQVANLQATDVTINTDLQGLHTSLGTVVTRLAALEAQGTGAQYLTSIIRYASDLGQPQVAGGTTTKATFNLAALVNDNSGTNPVFNFTDESIFTIKIRFTVDGGTAPADNRNLIFNINTGDAEPTILVFNDRTGNNANAGVILKATLSTAGLLTLETINVDGTIPTFSVINFSTVTVNQIQELVYTKASNLVNQAELAAVTSDVFTNRTNINTNTSDITNLTTRITATETAINGATGINDKFIAQNTLNATFQTKSDNGLNTTDKTIVGAINNLDTQKANGIDLTATRLSTTGLAQLVDLETKLGI